MNSFEINKIIAAVIVTVIIVLSIDKLADVVYAVKTPDNAAYKIAKETKEISKDDNKKAKESSDIKALLALGSIDHGKIVFKKCAACHSIAKGKGHKIGVNLFGVLGRQAGSVSDYKYSKAMVAYGKVWSFEEMNGFLIKPKDWIKGTKMSFAGLKNEKDRASVILYMNENSDSPLPLQ